MTFSNLLVTREQPGMTPMWRKIRPDHCQQKHFMLTIFISFNENTWYNNNASNTSYKVVILNVMMHLLELLLYGGPYLVRTPRNNCL